MRTAGRILKWTRVVASVLFLTLLTVYFVGAPLSLVGLGEWTASVQLVPAVLELTLGVFVAWMIITLVFGRIYCSTVCPIGTLSDIFERLRFGRRYRLTPTRQHYSQVILAIVVACTLGGLSLAIGLLDPFSQWGRMIESAMHPTVAKCIIAGTTLLIIALMAWNSGRLYCNMICPVGGALGIISRQSVFHVEIDPDRCIRCRRCVDVCKAECIDIEQCTVDNARCVDCFNCLAPCPVDAIRYTPDRKQLMTPMFRPIRRQGSAAIDTFGTETTSHNRQNQSSVNRKP